MHQLAAYLKEREGFDCIVTDEGFASYQITGDTCYIKDIWVHKDYRKKGLASEMADDITEIARKSGCKYLLGSVSTVVNGAQANLKVLLAYGFEIHSAVPGGVFFRKEL